MDIIYLDNSATTPVCPEAYEAMKYAMECYANPSSLHFFGHNAEKMINEARKSSEDYSSLLFCCDRRAFSAAMSAWSSSCSSCVMAGSIS